MYVDLLPTKEDCLSFYVTISKRELSDLPRRRYINDDYSIIIRLRKYFYLLLNRYISISLDLYLYPFVSFESETHLNCLPLPSISLQLQQLGTHVRAKRKYSEMSDAVRKIREQQQKAKEAAAAAEKKE